MSIYSRYQQVAKLPFGNWLFTQAVCFTAPYFRTMKPILKSLAPGKGEVLLKKRRRVHNHIQTVHVIAICNALEMAMGLTVEATIPDHLRWLPKAMSVAYPAKANSDILAVATVDPEDFRPDSDVVLKVAAYRDDGEVVVEGTITIWVTEKPNQ